MRALLALAALAAVLVAGATDVNNLANCKTPGPHGSTIDLSGIYPASYNATMVGVSGVADVQLNMAWCWSVNSTVCNSTVNQVLYVTSTAAALPACTASYGAFLGPIRNVTNGVTFNLWDTQNGYTDSVTVLCDRTGKNHTATLVGQVVNAPIYRYQMTFSSLHACPSV